MCSSLSRLSAAKHQSFHVLETNEGTRMLRRQQMKKDAAAEAGNAVRHSLTRQAAK